MRAAVAAGAILLAALPAVAARAQTPGDVPHYVERPAERRALVRRCQADAALAATRECQNARAAGTVEMMKRLPPGLLLPEWRMPRPAPAAPAPPPSGTVRKGAPRAA